MLGFSGAVHAQTPAACPLTDIGNATVRGALDGDIALEDGRIVRLAGIEGAESAGMLPAGTIITLKGLAATGQIDRYSRLVAHVFIARDGAERWLQQDLVGAGLARVSGRVGNAACAKALLAREQSARTGKLGLWREPYYVMGKAEEPLEVLKQRGRFALVEGRVLSVRESGATIYVNFGRRWSEDFTVTIAKRNERVFSAAGLTPKSLEGRRLRVRGWIEERGGPWVEAARPEQIEVLF
jgi:endonuclease YncB( thermonuclease family)